MPRWNGASRDTTFDAATKKLTAAIAAADVATAGTANVTVVNPEPGGGTSGALAFTIRAGDTTAPTTTAAVSPAPTGAGWNKAGVTVTLTATDSAGGSGVKQIAYSASGAQTIASTTANGATATVSVTAAGEPTIAFSAQDNAGNAEAAKTVTVKIDKTVPTIAIAAPNKPAYAINQVVTADYECTDSGSGIESCAGPVPDGSRIDTASLGAKAFAVKGTDKAGNEASKAASYTVAYDSCELLRVARAADNGTPPPASLVNDLKNAAKNGTPIPVLVHRCDVAGGPEILVTAQVVKERSDPRTGVYIVRFTAGGFTQTVKFRIKED